MHGVAVGFRVHRHRGYAHLLAGAVDAKSNLPAVGYEDFLKHRGLFDDDERFAEFNRLLIGHQDLSDLAGARGRHRIEGLHRLNQEQRLALFYIIADLHERRCALLWSKIDGAHHRRLNRTWVISSRGGGTWA